MPAGLTYTTLLAASRNYLERGFTTDSDPIVFAQLPSLITMAEQRCSVDLKVQGFQSTLTATMATGVPVIAKPNLWRETISFNFGTGTSNNTRKFLYPRSYEYCRVYWPDETQTAEPRYYADYDYQNWLIAGTPDAAYPFEVLCWTQPPYLDDTNQTNWLTDYAPNLLQYAVLLEATPFLKNDERIATWEGFYKDRLGAINAQDLQKMRDRGVIRTTA